MNVLQRLTTWGSFVKFSHSVFALPFALIMVVLVAREQTVSVLQVALLIVCVVSARTAAMAFNRYVDADIDAKNPRTEKREIPAGVVSKGSALRLILVSSGAFLLGTAGLGTHCLVLAPLVLMVLLGYSLVKRFSSVCHVILGIALALAPGGVWYALTGQWSWKPLPLMATVVFWVAGFDILYSCQDADFDRKEGLFSIPSRVGVGPALAIACALHVFSFSALVLNGMIFQVGPLYWVGVLIFAALLINQHRTVLARGVGCIDQVFFTRNGAASILLFVFVLLDAMIS